MRLVPVTARARRVFAFEGEWWRREHRQDGQPLETEHDHLAEMSLKALIGVNSFMRPCAVVRAVVVVHVHLGWSCKRPPSVRLYHACVCAFTQALTNTAKTSSSNPYWKARYTAT